VTGSVDLKEFLAGYLAEVEEHLGAAGTHLVAIDTASRQGEPQPRATRELFRSLHTIKGLSAMVGAEPIVDLAHAMETVMREADRSGGTFAPRAVDLLLQGLRGIEQRVRALAEDKPVPAAPVELIDALGLLPQAGGLPATTQGIQLDLLPEVAEKLAPAEREQLVRALNHGRHAWRIDFVPSPDKAARGLHISAVRERVGALAEIVKVVPRSVPRDEQAPGGLLFVLLVLSDAPQDQLAQAAALPVEAVVPITTMAAPAAPPVDLPPEVAAGDAGGRESPARRVVRVDVARLDEALDRLSALVVTRFRLDRAIAALAAQGVDVRRVTEILQGHARQLRDLRGSIMRARMVSVADLLERAPLIVRGLARSTGKPVHLDVDAGRAELDKAVGERLFPAIVHLIRNAVDHAIEPPEERRRLGKPAEGMIRITCHERGHNQLELSVSDDGRGIDRERVAARAGRPVPASDEGLLELLALPGLTTLDQATTTSGRGLGVDIVRRITVEELGGELMLRTERGRGTTFTLRVPLSITIVDAFSFVCSEQPFVTPVTAVDEILDAEELRLVRGPALARPRAEAPQQPRAAEVQLFERRGEAVPLVSLAEVFALPRLEVGRRKAIVIRRHGQPFAFLVDRILGQQEVVVRPIEDPLARVPGITGSTDLGDGRPTLVLDLLTLSGRVSTGAYA
jgi:two-component system chemotaxis sensor kinase CheA